MNIDQALTSIPAGLRQPLVEEYRKIIQYYLERRWEPSTLSAGKFCEIVYTIIDGYGKGSYAPKPTKPQNMADSCKRLENHSSSPRSFHILIPRMLPPLYEIRNNRNVGHTGGDVDPNSMDSNAVVSMCSWIMGELIRVYHNVDINQAQAMVDSITTRKTPLVWIKDGTKRVLKTELSIKDKILLLLSTESKPANTDKVFEWLDVTNKTYYKKNLIVMHKQNLVYLSNNNTQVEILPAGSNIVEEIVSKHSK